MSLKFTEELCLVTMKNDAKFEEELICYLIIDMRNLTNFDSNTQKSKTFAPYLFHDGGQYHIETSPLICRANQWTGFYMISASVVKELIGSFDQSI